MTQTDSEPGRETALKTQALAPPFRPPFRTHPTLSLPVQPPAPAAHARERHWSLVRHPQLTRLLRRRRQRPRHRLHLQLHRKVDEEKIC